MSRNELLLRERLDATSGLKSKNETAQITRVLRDAELDAVSGGLAGMDVSKMIECYEAR